MNLKSQQEVDTEDFNYNKPSQKRIDWLVETFDLSEDSSWDKRLNRVLLVGMILFIIGFVVSLIV